jgi:hypothetical protein
LTIEPPNSIVAEIGYHNTMVITRRGFLVGGPATASGLLVSGVATATTSGTWQLAVAMLARSCCSSDEESGARVCRESVEMLDFQRIGVFLGLSGRNVGRVSIEIAGCILVL